MRGSRRPIAKRSDPESQPKPRFYASISRKEAGAGLLILAVLTGLFLLGRYVEYGGIWTCRSASERQCVPPWVADDTRYIPAWLQ